MARVMRFISTNKANKPVAGIAANTTAIWNAGADGSDWEPAKNPTANLGKLWFHNALDYLRVARIVSSRDAGKAAVAIGATANNAPLNAEYVLFEHGLGYTPLISADIEVGGYVQPCAGSPVPIPGGAAGGGGYRWLGITSDATKVYMHARGFVCPAMTVHWKVRVYDETFQTVSDSATLFYASKNALEIDGIGKIRKDRRFVRKVPSGSGQFRALGRQTMKMVPTAGGPQLHFSDGVLNLYQFGFGNGVGTAGGTLAAPGTECEITGGSPRHNGFTYDDAGIELADGSDVVFTTARAMEVSLGQIKGTLSLPARAGADNIGDGHVVDWDIAAVPAATSFLRGFGQFSNATDFLPAARNFDFSGSVLLQGGATTRAGGGNTILGLRFVSPIISAGRLVIREEYYAARPPGGVDLGSVELKYDIRTAAFVGGI